MVFVKQKPCIAASIYLLAVKYVSGNLALVQNESDLLAHTCLPKMFFSVKVCKTNHILPKAVNLNSIHFPLTSTRCSQISV